MQLVNEGDTLLLHINRCGWQDRIKPVPVPHATISKIEELISEVTTEPQEEKMMGLDGTTYHLEVSGFGRQAKFDWWSEPPTGWKPLDEIVGLLLALAGPACSGYGSEQEQDRGNRTNDR